MTVIQANNLAPLVNFFSQPENQGRACLLTPAEGGYTCSLQPLDKNTPQETLEIFKGLIDVKRLDRIFQQPELQPYRNDYSANRLYLDKKVLSIVFLHLGNIQQEDLQDRLAPQNRELKALNVKEVDTLYRQLIPFKEVNDLFFGSVPQISYYDAVKTSGKGVEGLRERVKIQLEAYAYHSTTKPKGSERDMRDVEILTSRLGDREPPIGTVIRTTRDYHVYRAIFSGNGGYASLLQNFGNQQTLLVCRGTAMRWNATGGYLSGVNNLLWEPGMLAIRALWPSISAFLKENRVTAIQLLGKSQGGAHVQYLAPLIAKFTSTKVTKVFTYASIGVSEEVCEVFRKIFTGNAPEVVAIFNEGSLEDHQMDFVPLVGGRHVGDGRQRVSVVSITPPGSVPCDLEKISLITKLKEFIFSFSAHTRQTTLKPFQITKVSMSPPYLSRGLQLEGFRKIAAWIFHIFTLGYFHVSYKKYFEAQLKPF